MRPTNARWGNAPKGRVSRDCSAEDEEPIGVLDDTITVVLHLLADRLAEKYKIRFYDAIPPAFRIATRTVRHDEIIVRNTFVERNIAVGIRLGLRACTLKLRKERVPARVCSSEPLLKHCAGVDVPVLTSYFKDTPVELKDVRVCFCFQWSVAQRGVVEPIDVLSDEWTNHASMLQCSEGEMCWVRQGTTDG